MLPKQLSQRKYAIVILKKYAFPLQLSMERSANGLHGQTVWEWWVAMVTKIEYVPATTLALNMAADIVEDVLLKVNLVKATGPTVRILPF